MHSLPLWVSLAIALIVVPPAVRGLRAQGFVHENYRGVLVAFPGGVAAIAAAVVALIPLSLVAELADEKVFTGDAVTVVLYTLGVGLLGVLDDLIGSGALVPSRAADLAGPAPERPRGWRGHARATLGGGFSTGALKAVGALGLALFVLQGRGLSSGEYLLAAAVLVLATNLFNLLDLRPGRSLKALVLLGAGLTIGTRDAEPLWSVGLFAAPLLVLMPFDLREQAMLGDTGSNLAGAVAGLWLVLALGTLGQAIALGLMAVLTIYGEFRSISALIERTPLLRSLDSLGRATHA